MRRIVLSAAVLILLACAMNGDARSMVTRDVQVELKNEPKTVTLELGRQRTHALEVARDPKRHLMLRIEGISVQGEVGVWEVRVGDALAGTLATYGAQEQNGKYIASVPLDEAALRTLESGTKSLPITFAPT